MTDLRKNRKDGALPYFINWDDSAHPAENSPKGCSFIKLEVLHPDAKLVNEPLRILGIDFKAEPGKARSALHGAG
jgi:hypothetical protein